MTFKVEQARKLTQIFEKDQKSVDIYKLMRGDAASKELLGRWDIVRSKMLAITLPLRLHDRFTLTMDSLESIVNLYGELDEVPANLTERIHTELKECDLLYDQYVALCSMLGEPSVLEDRLTDLHTRVLALS